jgi:hypothetical protein
VSEIPEPEFWAAQNGLEGLLPPLDRLAKDDPDHYAIGSFARITTVRVYRRSHRVPHAELEPAYRRALPDDIALEFVEAAVTKTERQLISSGMDAALARLAELGIRVRRFGSTTTAGPLEICYSSSGPELNWHLLVETGATRHWPDDFVDRDVFTFRKEPATRMWDQLGVRRGRTR